MATLKLNTIELVSTLRTAPLNGSPSTQDYNDSTREVLADLAAITSFLNDSLRPLLNALPSTTLASTTSPIGIEGRTVFSDTSDQSSSLFFNTKTNTFLTLADSFRSLQGMLISFQTKLDNQQVQVASLQSRLASTNQNDIALALQNLSDSLGSLTSSIGSIQSRVTALEAKP